MKASPFLPNGLASVFGTGFLLACLALFVHAVLQWRGVVGDGHPWRPVSATIVFARSFAGGFSRIGLGAVLAACAGAPKAEPA